MLSFKWDFITRSLLLSLLINRLTLITALIAKWSVPSILVTFSAFIIFIRPYRPFQESSISFSKRASILAFHYFSIVEVVMGKKGRLSTHLFNSLIHLFSLSLVCGEHPGTQWHGTWEDTLYLRNTHNQTGWSNNSLSLTMTSLILYEYYS